MSKSFSSRLPVIAFAIAAVLSTSAVAAAGWLRVASGSSIISNYGGGAMSGCWAPSATSSVIYCGVADTSALPASSYTSVSVFFQNSNATQPVYACVGYYNAMGGICGSVTPSNNCAAHGVCSFNNVDISQWAANPDQFKFLEFGSITSGAQLAGYDLFY